VANNALYLNGKLATALHTTYAATDSWTSVEVDDIIAWAVLQLWPRYSRVLDPETTTVAVVDSDYYYDLPTGVLAVSRVDRYDSAGVDYGALHAQSWELVGDVFIGTGKLHIGGSAAIAADVLHLHGYGRYDVTTNLIPDALIPLVLARARAEAYRRVAADRERFKDWISRNQTQNVSVNELLGFINEADAEARRLLGETPRVWQRPVQGRVG